MYSKQIEETLSKKQIKLGDKIKLIKAGKEYDGILMPRPDSGDNKILIIKLANGYNIGVEFDSKDTISKSGTSAESFSFPKTKAHFKEGLHKVSLLYTGGTIGSKVDYSTGAVYMLTKPDELLAEVPELADIANIHVEHLMSVASEDMTPAEWKVMARSTASAFNSGASGVVITHGTDTMHYTSAALSFMLSNLPGPVAITGAQRSSDRGSSDAFMNLVCSTHLASKAQIAEVGICMHANSSDDYCNFTRGTKVRKLHTSSRNAFRPVNNSPLAKVFPDGKIELVGEHQKPKHGPKVEVKDGFEEKVALVNTYPGADPSILKYYSDKGYKGIIISGTGLGHAPVSTPHKQYNWLQSIKDCTASGVVVGMTSQCLFGRTNANVYRNLRLISDAGVIYCEDMLPETAYVKLGFLLGNYSKKQTEEMLPKNLVGEITKRTEADWEGE